MITKPNERQNRRGPHEWWCYFEDGCVISFLYPHDGTPDFCPAEGTALNKAWECQIIRPATTPTAKEWK